MLPQMSLSEDCEEIKVESVQIECFIFAEEKLVGEV